MLLISVHESLTQRAEYFTCLLLMRRSIYWLPKFNPYSGSREIKPATLIRNELNMAPVLLLSEWKGNFIPQCKVQEERKEQNDGVSNTVRLHVGLVSRCINKLASLTNQLHEAGSFLWNLQLLRYSANYWSFKEPYGSLAGSQGPSTGHCPETQESRKKLH
jgi:hypothetical protein